MYYRRASIFFSWIPRAVLWVFISEGFPNLVRAKGQMQEQLKFD